MLYRKSMPSRRPSSSFRPFIFGVIVTFICVIFRNNVIDRQMLINIQIDCYKYQSQMAEKDFKIHTQRPSKTSATENIRVSSPGNSWCSSRSCWCSESKRLRTSRIELSNEPIPLILAWIWFFVQDRSTSLYNESYHIIVIQISNVSYHWILWIMIWYDITTILSLYTLIYT